MRIRHLGSFFNVSLCRSLAAKSDVVADRPVKQHRLLTDDTNLLSQPLHVDVLNVMSVHCHLER